MLLDEAKGLTDFSPGKAGMLGYLDLRLKPKLCLTILPLNMHMHSRLFPRKEVEPETPSRKMVGLIREMIPADNLQGESSPDSA
jgi:hypothetical protein